MCNQSYIYVAIHKYTYTFPHAFAQMYVCVYGCIFVCTYVWSCVCMYVCMYVCVHTHIWEMRICSKHTCMFSLCICMYIHIRGYTYTYTYIYIYIHIHIHTYIYIYIYIYIPCDTAWRSPPSFLTYAATASSGGHRVTNSSSHRDVARRTHARTTGWQPSVSQLESVDCTATRGNVPQQAATLLPVSRLQSVDTTHPCVCVSISLSAWTQLISLYDTAHFCVRYDSSKICVAAYHNLLTCVPCVLPVVSSHQNISQMCTYV